MVIRLPKLDFLLQLGILLMVIKVSFNSSMILFYSEVMDTMLAAAAAGTLVLYILRQSFPKKVLAGYFLIGLLAGYCVLKTGNYGFLITVVLCMAMRKVSFDAVIRHIFVYESIFFILHTCYSLICWFFLKIPFTQNIYGTIRCSFGFVHPNMFSMYVFQLILLWIWLNYERIKKKHIVILAVIAVIVVCLSKTRTSFLDTIILCLLLLFANRDTESGKRFLTLCAQYAIPVAGVITLFLSFTYVWRNPVSIFADKLLNSRVRLGGYAYERYGMTLFGQNLSDMKVEWDPFWGITEHTFDNIYTAAAVNYGLIWLVTIGAAFYILAKKGNKKINICLIMWALYGVTEVHGLNAFLCFPILLIVLLYSEKREEENLNE